MPTLRISELPSDFPANELGWEVLRKMDGARAVSMLDKYIIIGIVAQRGEIADGADLMTGELPEEWHQIHIRRKNVQMRVIHAAR